MDRARPAKSDKDITKISVELLYLKIEEMVSKKWGLKKIKKGNRTRGERLRVVKEGGWW